MGTAFNNIPLKQKDLIYLGEQNVAK